MNAPDQTDPTNKGALLRPTEVAAYLGVSVATFWRYAKNDPAFPKPIKLSAGVTVVPLDELAAWVDTRRRNLFKPFAGVEAARRVSEVA